MRTARSMESSAAVIFDLDGTLLDTGTSLDPCYSCYQAPGETTVKDALVKDALVHTTGGSNKGAKRETLLSFEHRICMQKH